MHNLRLLTVFAQAARSGSFTMAAKVLHSTPGLVSKNVAQLEQDAGIRLFNRTTRRLNLTEEGAEFYNAVRLGLEQLERADDVSAAARNQVDGLVRLPIGGAFGKTQVLPALSALLNRHQSMRLEVAFSDEAGDLISHGFDIAVRCGAPQDSRLICRRLVRLPLKLVASPSYVERHGQIMHPQDLLQRDCINVRHGTEYCAWTFHSRSDRAATHVQVKPPGRMVIIEHVEAVVEAALGGFGPTVIDALAAAPHLEAGTLVELLPDWQVEASIEEGSDIYLVYPHRDYLPLRIRVVIDFLVDKFGSGAARDIMPAALYRDNGMARSPMLISSA